VYGCNIALGDIPHGGVQCPKCASLSGVMLQYASGTTIFSFAGLDKRDHVIYTASHTTGKWYKGMVPFAALCATCAHTIPIWMLSFNRYIASTFKT